MYVYMYVQYVSGKSVCIHILQIFNRIHFHFAIRVLCWDNFKYFYFLIFPNFSPISFAEGVLADLKASESLPPASGLGVRGFLTTVTQLSSKVDDPLRF